MKRIYLFLDYRDTFYSSLANMATLCSMDVPLLVQSFRDMGCEAVVKTLPRREFPQRQLPRRVRPLPIFRGLGLTVSELHRGHSVWPPIAGRHSDTEIPPTSARIITRYSWKFSGT